MKGVIGLFAVVVVVAVLALALVPGFGQSIVSSLTGVHVSCNFSQLDKDCICSDDENRLSYMWNNGIPMYACEKKVLALNPDDLNSIKAYAQQKLAAMFPSCASIGCAGGNIETMVGQQTDGNRFALIECKLGIEYGTVPWAIYLDLEDGSPLSIGRYPWCN